VRRQGHGKKTLLSWRWLAGGVLVAVLLVLAAGGLLRTLSRGAATSTGGVTAPGAGGSQSLAAAAAARSRALTWIAGQIGRDVVVACDHEVCSALAARGFPAGNLVVLAPTAPDPMGAAVVIATADIRSQFGSKLASVYAPAVIASFGGGSARIDIRVIAPDGAAAYRTALSADLRARKASAAELLGNRKVEVSAAARRQLSTGQVDARLLIAIDALIHQHPVDIIGFGGSAPGAAPGTPLRFADLAETDRAARMRKSAYVQSMLALLQAQNPSFRPLRTATVRVSGGESVLRIEYAAPSPLGLFNSP
jgi:hypothetical protein